MALSRIVATGLENRLSYGHRFSRAGAQTGAGANAAHGLERELVVEQELRRTVLRDLAGAVVLKPLMPGG
jgi:hypothetical protein